MNQLAVPKTLTTDIFVPFKSTALEHISKLLLRPNSVAKLAIASVSQRGAGGTVFSIALQFSPDKICHRRILDIF